MNLTVSPNLLAAATRHAREHTARTGERITPEDMLRRWALAGYQIALAFEQRDPMETQLRLDVAILALLGLTEQAEDAPPVHGLAAVFPARAFGDHLALVSAREGSPNAPLPVELLRSASEAVDAFDQANTQKAIANLGTRGDILVFAINGLRALLARTVHPPTFITDPQGGA